MSLVHNERTKLTATYLNGAAVAALAVGCLAPVVGFANLTVPGSALVVALTSFGCLTMSIVLNLAERWILPRLVE